MTEHQQMTDGEFNARITAALQLPSNDPLPIIVETQQIPGILAQQPHSSQQHVVHEAEAPMAYTISHSFPSAVSRSTRRG